MLTGLKKMAVGMLTGMAVLAVPANAFAMSADEKSVDAGYGQTVKCSFDINEIMKADDVYGMNFILGGNVELEYCWDEGYASDFISGSGSVYVAGIPDIIRKDGWTVEMQEGRITGSTIVFTVVLKLDDVEMERMDIAYYVDEYGQVEK